MTNRSYTPGRITEIFGLSAEWLAKVCGVHITTARRWKRGEAPPKAALEIIQLRATGELGVVDGAWSGWRLVNGVLYSPEQMDFTPADVRAGPFWRQLARSYQAKQRLPQQADWVAGEWTIAKAIEDERAAG